MNAPSPNPYAPPTTASPPPASLGTFEFSGDVRFGGTIRRQDVITAYRRPRTALVASLAASISGLLAAVLLALVVLRGPIGVDPGLAFVGLVAGTVAVLTAYRASGRSDARRWRRDFAPFAGPWRGRFSPAGWEIAVPGRSAQLTWDAVAGVHVTERALLIGLDLQMSRVLILPSHFFDDRDGQHVWNNFCLLERDRPLVSSAPRSRDRRLFVGEPLRGAEPRAEERTAPQIVPFAGTITTGRWLRTRVGWRPHRNNLIQGSLVACAAIVLMALGPGMRFSPIEIAILLLLGVGPLIGGAVGLWNRMADNPRPLAHLRGTFDSRGITLALPILRVRFDWPALTGARVDRDTIVLGVTHNRRHAFALPRGLFATEREWQQAVEWVAQNVAPHRSG